MSSIFDRLALAFFAIGLVALAFLGGALAIYYRLPPSDQLAQLDRSLRAAKELYFGHNDRLFPVDHTKTGVTVHTADASPGFTLVVGYVDDGFRARLIDLDGKVAHEWRAKFSEVFGAKAPQLIYQAKDEEITWHGAHLFPNGDLLFNFMSGNFPFGSGLVKLDKDSRVIWKLERNTHHDVDVADDGTIWTPAHHWRADGRPDLPRFRPGFYDDTLLHVSADGQVIEEISLLDLLKPYPGLFPPRVGDDDPTHLNGVEVLSERMAAAFPQWAPGDLLISPRQLNMVMVVDPKAKVVKWIHAGQFVRQHDPDFLPDGNIMVFDNRGGDQACGRTRVLELEPMSEAMPWHYEGCFYTHERGKAQALPNGDVLITVAEAGRVFEVTHEAQPRIVWEYYNGQGKVNGKLMMGLVTQGERYPPEALTFLSPPS